MRVGSLTNIGALSAKTPYLPSCTNLSPLDDALQGLMKTLMFSLIALLRTAFLIRTNLAPENAALRQQLTIYQRNQKHPKLRTGDRVFWVLLRRLCAGWERSLLVIKPQTVIAWHRQSFRDFWHRLVDAGLLSRERGIYRRVGSSGSALG